MIKICSPQLGISPISTLGGEIHDHFIIQNLASLGNTIYVYLPKNRKYKKNKNIVVSFAPVKHIPAFLFNFLIIPYLFLTYKREKFDILRIHSPYFIGLGALVFKFFNHQVPLVATYHLAENGQMFSLINRLTVNKYDGIIAVSQYVKNWLVKKYNVPPNKIIVIYNGVDKNLTPKKKDLALVKKYKLKDNTTLLYMGLLIERKNPMVLLKVYKKLKIENKKIALIICGEGPMKKKMENFVNNYKLKNVIFTGNVFGQEKINYLNLTDIFVFPSKNEGFGLAVAEAAACAKPSVVTGSTSLKEIVKDQETGFLAKEDDIKDWVSNIQILIKSKQLREKMGKRAKREAAENFDWTKNTKKTENYYLKLLRTRL
jgi:glycosyltransferase involved in cell wall biosynthesis